MTDTLDAAPQTLGDIPRDPTQDGPKVRLYLDDAPSRAELEAALALLGRPAADLLRWKEKDRPEGLTTDAPEAAILDALAANPRLIERPLVLSDSAARLGRPPEAVLDLL